jgi:hypothetical protein
MTPGHEPTGGRAHLPRHGGGSGRSETGRSRGRTRRRACGLGHVRGGPRRCLGVRTVRRLGRGRRHVYERIPSVVDVRNTDLSNTDDRDVSAPSPRENVHSSRARGCPGDG